MQRLTIDIGNSSAKIAVFADREIIHHLRLLKVGIIDLAYLIDRFSPQKAIISSVNQEITPLEGYLKKHTNYTRFSTSLTNGVINRYQTPNTLGLDRWAAMLGANGLGFGKACLVIDAGTCITYDLLTGKSEYFGGSISPGIKMRFKSMHEYTGRLPEVSWDANEGIPEGFDTISAMKNGVLQGIINEIEGYIALNNIKESTLKVIITGGDANFLFKQLQNSIFAPQIIKDPYLVLKGLNEAIAD
ncbi:type III pantothenate kinase [Pedobacter psychrotolerans]|uniref:Type III pantothenate kinase n=1 Tax=Pedobacter psychrotolerans TaxID=1843235 RepID=A0A4R2HFA1_9SPHI|nr:type III pantothenate kinase [Pedobacter psychrotolerans]TCO27189.1 type III pantothenate kinase [Pedobacter psychrotolerans]GGE59636.1 type III pantothenate kinase [Pedobacter psychrotolerans]